jgi:RNA-directed DNA polymerase
MIVEGRNLGNYNLKKETYMIPAENRIQQRSMTGLTKNRYDTATKLARIAWMSRQNPCKVFACLMHHYNRESLIKCYLELDGSKALGIDRMSKEQYGENLGENIEDLLERMKKMAYRPQAVRQVLIPKEGKPGATRPLGISCFEDKIVQNMTRKVLESIYDPIFYDCSYGFRPGRGCHDAVKDLQNYLHDNEVEVVIDIDLGNFFGTIDHTLLSEMLETRIKDIRFMRYIKRMFKAGVLSEGELSISEEGVPQGSVCSPILANVYAHYVIDEWVCKMIQPFIKGKVRLFRYADDAIICCEKEEDAKKIRETLTKRLERYKLHLNEEKTKMVPFSKRKAARGEDQGTFDFLGFTFFWGKSRSGRIVPRLKTIGKRFTSKLKKVNEWMKSNRNTMKLTELWNRFCNKLRGHGNYYGVSHNAMGVAKFFHQALGIFHKWINRRSQRKSWTWDRFQMFMEKFPPPTPKVVHRLF